MQGVVKFNKKLEAALFFIFIFEFLRRYSETEPLLLSVLGLFGMVIVVLLIFDFKFKKTEDSLGIKFSSWKRMVDDLCDELKNI